MTRRVRAAVLSAAVLALSSVAARAQSLGLSDPAPALQVKEFLKGDPVKSFEKGKTYVVEFWATWCGPCKVSIPHVSELQKKYPAVTFIGVSVWEQSQKEVAPFVKEMGDKMAYRVAMDDVPAGGEGNEGKMAQAWMKAAGEDGIPSAFIVNGEGRVAWIGHPMAMDKPLEQIVAGKYDLAAAVQERKDEKEAQEAFSKLRDKLIQAQKAGNGKEMLRVIDEAFQATPALEKSLGMMKFSVLMKLGDSKDAVAYGEKLFERLKDNAEGLNNLAWMVVDPDNDLKPAPALVKLALKVATRADEVKEGKDAAIADTLAKAQFDSGDAAKAYETQKRALKLSEGTPLAEQDQGMKQRLEQYKKAAEAKDKP